MGFKNNLARVALLGTLALGGVGCSQGPTIEEKKDLTGDGIEDIIVYTKMNKWLFIGQEDGSFICAKEYVHGETKYFKTNSGATYFWDGEFHRPSPKQE